MENKITIGARGSKLSLAYAKKVKSIIFEKEPQVDKDIIIKTIKTSGDLFQNKKISENTNDQLGSISGGMGLPPGLKLPF